MKLFLPESFLKSVDSVPNMENHSVNPGAFQQCMLSHFLPTAYDSPHETLLCLVFYLQDGLQDTSHLLISPLCLIL